MNALHVKKTLILAAIIALLAQSVMAQMPASNRVVMVPSFKAMCMAIDEREGLLALGERDPSNTQGRVTLCKLNAQGAPTGAPVYFPLSPPAAVGQRNMRPTGMAFHPTRPLLYLWQDLDVKKPDAALAKSIQNSLEHLLVLRIAPNTLTQVFSGAVGTFFAFGQAHGRIAIEPEGRRLFIPNMRAPGKGNAAIGCYDLDSEGLPMERDGEPAIAWVDTSQILDQPTGLGFHPASKNVTLFSGRHGPAVWDTENRLAPLCALPLAGVPAAANMIAGHPALPIVYGVGVNVIFGMEHSGGFPTMLPWKLAIPNAAFCSLPIVMSRAPSFMAIGESKRVWFVALDQNGRFSGQPAGIPVASERPQAIVYSPKFDRLYIAVNEAVK